MGVHEMEGEEDDVTVATTSLRQRAAFSEDRRSLAFAYVTFSEPGGHDTEKTVWMTVTGVITCPEPLPEIQGTPT